MKMPSMKKPLGMTLQGIVAGDETLPPVMGGMGDTIPGLGGMPAKPRGLFADGSKGQMIAGLLGDALTSINGGPALFTQSQMQQRNIDREQAQWGLRRKQNMDDFEQQQAIRAKYDVPSPYRFKDNAGNLVELGADGQSRTLYNDPTPKMNFISDGMGGGQWVAAPGQAQTMPAPQGGAPALPQGYTVRKPGGGVSNGPGNFPR